MLRFQALGRFEEAINDCKSAIEKDPEVCFTFIIYFFPHIYYEWLNWFYNFMLQEYAAWFNLGNVDARINKFDDALVAYKRASLLAPGIAGYRLKEALILFQVPE
jgi:tetratricopeptide (TPR) repeat protein